MLSPKIGLSDDWRVTATTLLAAGLPLDLNRLAAAAYLERCAPVVDAIGCEDSLLAVRVLSAQAVAAAQVPGAPANVAVLAVEQMAARLGDDLSRAYALMVRSLVQPTPEFVDARLAAAREVLVVSERHGEADLTSIGYHLLMVALLEKGQIHVLDTAIMDRRQATVDPSRPQSFDPAGWFRCLRKILDGDAELAEQQAEQLLAASTREGSNAALVHTTQMGIIRWMSGRIEGAEDDFLAARREYPDQLLWPASLAWIWLAQGRTTAADALLKSLPDLQDIPRDRYWLSTITVLAQIAATHGSRERALELHALLEPFADHLVPVGNGVAFWGTAARTLGLLEERLGMYEAARAHLEMAVEITSRVGAQAWLAEAQIELAKFAIRHGLADVPAYNLLSQARSTCEARGFAGLATLAVQPTQIRVFGRFEVIPPHGHVAQWSSRKARELLKMLVAARGVATSREVFMEQLWPGQNPALLTNRFSVAVNTIRRALDPSKQFSRQHYLVVDGGSVRLNLDHLDIDLERFFALLKNHDDASWALAADMYIHQAFPDEPYADWAIAMRDEVAHAWARARSARRGSGPASDTEMSV